MVCIAQIGSVPRRGKKLAPHPTSDWHVMHRSGVRLAGALPTWRQVGSITAEPHFSPRMIIMHARNNMQSKQSVQLQQRHESHEDCNSYTLVLSNNTGIIAVRSATASQQHFNLHLYRPTVKTRAMGLGMGGGDAAWKDVVQPSLLAADKQYSASAYM